MVDVHVLPGFVAVILLFLIPPGPDMAYMIAVGLQGGRGSALKAILGIGTGMSVYAAAVVAGLGGIAQSQPSLLDAVKVLGGLYLLWLAFVTLRRARRSVRGPTDIATQRWYARGLLISVTNPKIILFFLAVLPQFIGDSQNPTAQLAMLGAVNVCTEVLLYGSIGVLAGVFHSRFVGNPRSHAVLNYIACAVYVALAGIFLTEALTT